MLTIDELVEGLFDLLVGEAEVDASAGAVEDVGHWSFAAGQEDWWACGDVFEEFVGQDTGVGVLPFKGQECVGVALDIEGLVVGDFAEEFEGVEHPGLLGVLCPTGR